MCADSVVQDLSKIDSSGFDSAPDEESARRAKKYARPEMSAEQIAAEPDPDVREGLVRLAANRKKARESV